MAIRHWNDAVDGPFSEAVMRQKLDASGDLVARYTYPPGTSRPEHSHDLNKIDAVISGRFLVVVAGHLACSVRTIGRRLRAVSGIQRPDGRRTCRDPRRGQIPRKTGR